MTQVAEKRRCSERAREASARADRAGWRICAAAARRSSPRSAFRPCATRSGGSPTSRRSARSTSRRPGPISGAAERLNGFAYTDAPLRLVIVNGRSTRRLSRTKGLPAGVVAGSLAVALKDHADVVQRYFGQLADFTSRSFDALNTAFVQDGAFVHVPDGAVARHADPRHLRLRSRGRVGDGASAHADRRRRQRAGHGDRELRRR